ncbi:hypothetical protein GGI23_006402 [Coemansia sp. RSA 2559]|nr:hypothetical protein GGI23_006402 [Coemansia sp. RSA 2559]
MKVSALEEYTVRHVLEYRGKPTLQHSVTENDTIEDALALMNRYNIVSVPVFGCSSVSGSSDGAFVDILSVYDLRDYIVNSPGLDDEVAFQLLSSHASGKHTVLQTMVAQVVGSRKHASQEIDAQASLESLMRLFTVHGQHRVLVTGMRSPEDDGAHLPEAAQQVPKSQRERGGSVDSGCSSLPSTNGHDDDHDGYGYCRAEPQAATDNGSVCGLTQYDVLRFIQHHNHVLGHSILDTSVTDIMKGLPQQHLFLNKITVRDPALHALKQLSAAHASALPVVDYDGKLITEVAGTSMRSLTTQTLGLLGKPVLAYMFGLRMPMDDPYIVHPTFNISQIMSGLLRMNCRRAWVVDSDQRPLAVISLADVLGHFL